MRGKYFTTSVGLISRKQMQKYPSKNKGDRSQLFEEGSKEQPSFQKELPISPLTGIQGIHSIACQSPRQQRSVIQPNDVPIKKGTHTRLSPMPFPLLSVIISKHRLRVSRVWPVLRTTSYKLRVSVCCSSSTLPFPFSPPASYPILRWY